MFASFARAIEPFTATGANPDPKSVGMGTFSRGIRVAGAAIRVGPTLKRMLVPKTVYSVSRSPRATALERAFFRAGPIPMCIMSIIPVLEIKEGIRAERRERSRCAAVPSEVDLEKSWEFRKF